MEDLVFDLIKQEKTRQEEGLELIPSENYVSPAVLKAMGSILTNKYSEGYPNFEGLSDWSEKKIATEILPNYRYYGGQENIDRIERIAIERACRLFHADHANVQPHSGAQANMAVYNAWCQPGDTILSMSLPAGGHLTHGAKVTLGANIWNFVTYGVTDNDDINYDELEKLAKECHPKLILVGYSAFTKIPDFTRVAKIRDEISQETGQEILLMADMAHVAGLIAGKVHPNPLDYGFNVMTTTTHKTLRGPRGGLILSKGRVATPLKKPEHTLENIPILIDHSVFPGTQGGPHDHIIAAKAVTFGEDLMPDFHSYAKKIIENAAALADSLKENGFKLVGDGTENHLILIDIKNSYGIDGKFYEKALDKIGLTLNANALPSDPAGSFNPSGVRLGTPAITTRGLNISEMSQIARWMKAVALICQEAKSIDHLNEYQDQLDKLRSAVREVALRFPLPND